MIQIQNISLAFGGQTVFKDLTWTLKPGHRTGLIGPNGAGKSTLLRIVTRQIQPDSGSVAMGSAVTVGYLEQDVHEMSSDRTVLDVALDAFSRVVTLEQRETEITKEIGSMDHNDPAYSELLNELDRVHADLNHLEGHMARPKTESVLMGLGFSVDDFDRPLSSFSGGWRMRVALAKLLLERPSFLLLDEPTNHLDIDSIDWLETYLKNYQGSVVIVSHDRYFLDRMVDRIADLRHGKIDEYAGNYSFYLSEKDERHAHLIAAYENQQREIAQAERFIERFRAKASKARQVQSRIKALERMERIPTPDDHEASIAFRFREPERSGKVVLELSTFSKTYNTPEKDIVVFDDADPITIERGDKIALIGINGAGKSTFARIINEEESFDGELKLGYNVTRTFFAQHQADTLDKKLSVLECLEEVAEGQTETELRSLLGTFLFTGDDVFKKVAVLSGGEKSRVALARTLLKPSNFLILDEPTNHLDIQSIGVLVEALRQYSGTFVVVSHDRHFLDQVANRVLRAGDGHIRSFIGNYSEYKWQVEHGTAASMQDNHKPQDLPSDNGSPKSGGKKSKERKRREAEERQRLSQMLSDNTDIDYASLTAAQLDKLYRKTEQQIFKVERKQRKLESALASPEVFEDLQEARRLTAEYDDVKAKLEKLYEEWESIASIMETS
ncbi:MAG: ABC-F family ATP-binding cassette domain-containing protein [Rhodothermales bacterium]|nr:ABC-F family ATP-binding cassette domain-containing protein [Rhodothermales bacterium]